MRVEKHIEVHWIHWAVTTRGDRSTSLWAWIPASLLSTENWFSAGVSTDASANSTFFELRWCLLICGTKLLLGPRASLILSILQLLGLQVGARTIRPACPRPCSGPIRKPTSSSSPQPHPHTVVLTTVTWRRLVFDQFRVMVRVTHCAVRTTSLPVVSNAVANLLEVPIAFDDSRLPLVTLWPISY